ncbi:Transposable element [Takifugu flavidus]|uniref:Transposable element n=1 Tax=Takifugu flavidus TaxID=433684 RepID=A0A5C6N9W0_9TELE|nr:Transposable element [Takifugu flavidus]
MVLYSAPSIFPSILTIFPVPAEEKQAQTMMLPPPCLTVGMRQKKPIHPSILYCLSGVGPRVQQPKKRSPDFPIPSYFFQLIRRDPQAFPDQSRDLVSPMCPRSSRGPPNRGTCPERLTREASRGHPN